MTRAGGARLMIGSGLAALVVGLTIALAPGAAAQPPSNPGAKVTVCHRTGSATNPYVRISVGGPAASRPGAGHAGHAGDIIPPHSGFAGQNWNSSGQSVWNANCATAVTTTTVAPTTTTSTTTTTAPTTTTSTTTSTTTTTSTSTTTTTVAPTTTTTSTTTTTAPTTTTTTSSTTTTAPTTTTTTSSTTTAPTTTTSTTQAAAGFVGPFPVELVSHDDDAGTPSVVPIALLSSGALLVGAGRRRLMRS